MKILPVIISVVLLVILPGCGSQRKTVTNYYLIELPGTAELPVKEKEPKQLGLCEINPVQVAPAFNTQKIAIRSNTREIKYYSYHFWAQRPGESLNTILEGYFTNSGIFEGITTRYWRLNPDYKIIMDVSHLEMVEQEDQVSAHLALELKLIDPNEKQVLLSHRADRHQILANKNLNIFAQVIGELLYDELDKFSNKIINTLTEQ